jgi:hypothetical protein
MASTTPVPASQAPALPYNTNVPAPYIAELQKLSAAGQLSGIPPQVLTYIMEAESGPSYKGGGWNGVAGGWFGLETPDGLTQAQITDPSLASFDTQAEVAAKVYARLLAGNSGNPVAAENAYQTGKPGTAANGAGIFEHFGLLDEAGALVAGAVGNAEGGGVVPASPTPLPGSSGVNVGGGVKLGWADELGTLLGDLTNAQWWERVGLFAAGAALVIVGIVVFISTTKTGQKVESDAAVAALA